MRLRRARVERFKKFEAPGIEIDFRNSVTGDVSGQYLILGDNASGKTTILQAIALTLALAQRKVQDFRQFGWTGWVADRFLAHGDPIVELEVEFDSDELVATQEAATRWWDATHPTGRAAFVLPGNSAVVRLRLEGTRVRVLGDENELLQFQGRSYAAAGAKMDRNLRDLFPRLPGVFWYDQFRNTASSVTREHSDRNNALGTELPYYLGVAQLEKNLKEWHSIREQRGPHPRADFLGQIQSLYEMAFPGHTFAGLEPVYDGPTPDENRFILSDGVHTYALAEMSSGEQAIFPILFQYVKQQIHRSVVIIDEIDLNLHPSLAQLLLGMLPRLGEKNQFLFTTHSRSVSSLVSPYTITRLPEGNLCL
jgi:predicted ATPase